MRLALLFALMPLPALADPCLDRLTQLVLSPALVAGPHEIHSEGMMGSMQTSSVHYYVDQSHYLVRTALPAGIPDTLHHEGGMYRPDGSGGWTLSQQVDSAGMEAEAAAMRQGQADAITAVQCSTALRDDRPVVILEGQIAPIPPYNVAREMTYVLDTATGTVIEHGQSYAMHGMQTDVTFTYLPAPGLELPLP